MTYFICEPNVCLWLGSQWLQQGCRMIDLESVHGDSVDWLGKKKDFKTSQM